MDSHIVKLTVDMFQISYSSLIELKIERSALYLHTQYVSCATNIQLETGAPNEDIVQNHLT